MRGRIGHGVLLRPDDFGGIAYVPARDDFFCVDSVTFAFLKTFSRSAWTSVEADGEEACREMAALGILETDTTTAPRSYSGPGFIGAFKEIATLSEPLVVNCFATALCPLKCQYCHADDLMQPARRKAEEMTGDSDLENVIATAKAVNSMVAVITGGDPLTRPARARRLIDELHGHKALVVDTSGVAPPEVLEEMLPYFRERGVHLRLSLDSFNPHVHEAVRPINRKVLSLAGSHAPALQTLDKAIALGIPLTIQTVVTSRNDKKEALLGLRDFLVSRGVRHWVLHLMVVAGAARRFEASRGRSSSRGSLLPHEHTRAVIWGVVRDTIDRGVPLDIRVTDNHNTPNSVLLVDSEGVLHTEGLAHHGKVELFDPRNSRPDLLRKLFYYIDRFGHARRYLNWNPDMFDRSNLEQLCISVKPPAPPSGVGSIVESERKFKVAHVDSLIESLADLGYVLKTDEVVDDRYYDNGEASLRAADFAVRLRQAGGTCMLAQKGPRFRQKNGEYDRVEVEVPVRSLEEAEESLLGRGLKVQWRLSRRRRSFGSVRGRTSVVIDDLASVGVYAEIEGLPQEIEAVVKGVRGLGEPETRNYRELIHAVAVGRKLDGNTLRGLDERGLIVGSND